MSDVNSLRQRLFTVAHTDEDVRRRGRIIIGLSITFVALSLVFGFLGLFQSAWLRVAGTMAVCSLIFLSCIWLARSGTVARAAWVLLAGMVAVLIVAPLLAGRLAATPFFFAIPVFVAMLTLRPSQIGGGLVLTLGGLALLFFSSASMQNDNVPITEVFVLGGMLCIVIAGLGYVSAQITSRAVTKSQAVAAEMRQVLQVLERERTSLGKRVAERTVELQNNLVATRQLADEQSSLLQQLEAQRTVIRNLSVPILPVSQRTLVVPLVGVLDQDRLNHLQAAVLENISAHSARSILLDVTGVPVIDAEVAAGLVRTIRAAGLLGARAALIGVRPEVAQALVSIGAELDDVVTYSNLQSALEQRTR